MGNNQDLQVGDSLILDTLENSMSSLQCAIDAGDREAAHQAADYLCRELEAWKQANNTVHRGVSHARTMHSRLEKSFADVWERENRRRAGINCGQTLLSALLTDKDGNPVYDIGPDEACIAATVVQWLGTNCGMFFLREALAGDRLKIVEADR